MNIKLSNQRKEIVGYLVGVIIILTLVLIYLIIFPVNTTGPRSPYEKAVKKLDLITTMRINLLASTEAEKSSVMADTDEASQAFAEQSMQASADVEKARRELAVLMEGGAHEEMNLFQEFSTCWEKLQEIDREVLTLAIQNTNLKALRLSFVPAREIIVRIEGALNQLMDATASSPVATGVSRLAYEVISGIFNLYTLQSPHIIETTPDKMDEIEAVMKGFDKQVKNALKDLEMIIGKQGRASFEVAKTSYEDYQRIHAEIIALSRRNTNIRSFAMSLGQRRNVTAQCQATLLALQKVVESRRFEATR